MVSTHLYSWHSAKLEVQERINFAWPARDSEVEIGALPWPNISFHCRSAQKHYVEFCAGRVMACSDKMPKETVKRVASRTCWKIHEKIKSVVESA